MGAQQNLFYGFGQVIYAIAISDDKIQSAEYERFKSIVLEGINKTSVNFEFSEIISSVLENQSSDSKFAYNSDINTIKSSATLITSEIKKMFLQTATEIAEAFMPITQNEQSYLTKFFADLELIVRQYTHASA